ncbi:MAG: cadherin repeat domain-containing protein, partial [Mobilitalea sp.]
MKTNLKRIISIVTAFVLIVTSVSIATPKVASAASINATQVLDQNWMADVTNGFSAQASAEILPADAASGEKILYFNSNSETGQWMEFSAAESEGLVSFDLTSLKLGKYTYAANDLTFKITATKVDNSEMFSTISWVADDGAFKVFSGTDITKMTGIKKFKIEIVEFGTGVTIPAYNLEFFQFTIANPVIGNSAPVLSGFTPAPSSFQENLVNATPQALVQAITVSDSESLDFNGGQVTVSYTGTPLSQDQLSIGNIGDISVSGANINYSTLGTIGSLSGGNDGTNLVIALNDKATPAIVMELLKALTYGNSSDEPASYRTISINVSDGDGGTSGAVTSIISVTGQAEGGAESPALIQNTNKSWIADLNNGFTIAANGGRELGSDTSYIWINIGSAGPESMTISSDEQFNGGVFDLSEIAFDVFNAVNTYTVTIIGHKGNGGTVSISKTIANNTTFSAAELSTMTELESFDIQVVNLTGGTPDVSLLSLKSFTITNPKAYVGNVAPSISGFTDTIFQENTVNAAPQQLDSDIQLTDSDSANLEGGQITVSYQAAGLVEDQLMINSVGNISVDTNKINYIGVGEIGTFSGGTNGTNLVITLNSTATPGYATELLQAIAYQNTSDEPSSYRTINIISSDGDGGLGNLVSAQISVSGQPEVGVEAPALIQYLNYPDWGINLNNGFTATISSGYKFSGDAASLWIDNEPAGLVQGPVTITFTPAEQFAGGMFNLDNIDFYIFESATNTHNYTVVVTGNTAVGGTVTASVTGKTTEIIKGINLSNMDNLISYTVTITGEDISANVNIVGMKSFTISNPGAAGIAPVITSNGGGTTANISVEENTTAVTTVTATDSDTVGALSYTISVGADAAAFQMDATSGELVFKTAPDREVKSTYTVVVQVSDGTLTDTQTLTITISDINDNMPVITSNGG